MIIAWLSHSFARSHVFQVKQQITFSFLSAYNQKYYKSLHKM